MHCRCHLTPQLLTPQLSSTLDALKKCDTVHRAVYGLLLGMFVAYMTYMMIMATLAGVGIFYLSTFAAAMEIMFGDMLTRISKTC